MGWIMLAAGVWVALLAVSLAPYLPDRLPRLSGILQPRAERQRIASGNAYLWEAEAILRGAAKAEGEALVLWHVPEDWRRIFAFEQFTSGLYPLRIVFIPLSSPFSSGEPIFLAGATPVIWATHVLGGIPGFFPQARLDELDTSAISWAVAGSHLGEMPALLYRVSVGEIDGLMLEPARTVPSIAPRAGSRRPWLWPLGLFSVLLLGTVFMCSSGLARTVNCSGPAGLAVSFLSGVGIVMYLMMAASFLGIGWNLLLPGSAMAVVAGLALHIGYRNLKLAANEPEAPSLGPVDRIGIILIAAALLFAVVRALAPFPPIENWDAWALWDLKSKACWLERGIPFSYLADERFGYTNRDYPLALPMLQAYLASWAAGVDTLLLRLVSPVFHACLIVLTAAILRETGVKSGRWLIAGLLGLTPTILNQASNGYADIVLAAAMLGCVFLTLRFLCGSAPLWSVAWLGAIAASIKEEGILFGAACLTTAAFAGRKRPRAFARALRSILLFLALLMPWRAVIASFEITTINRVSEIGQVAREGFPRLKLFAKAALLETLGPGLNPDSLKADRLADILCGYGDSPKRAYRLVGLITYPISHWMALWHFFILAILLRWRRLKDPPHFQLGSILGMQAAGYAAAYAASVLPLPWHLGTSLDRLLMQVLPLALILAASLVFGSGSLEDKALRRSR